jgi:hypothetical protein
MTILQSPPEIVDLGNGRLKKIRIIFKSYKIFPFRCKQPEAILLDIGDLDVVWEIFVPSIAELLLVIASGLPRGC